MIETFNKKDLRRLTTSILVIEAKVGEFRFRLKDFKATDLGLDNKAMEKLNDSFGVKTQEEFVDFIKSLY